VQHKIVRAVKMADALPTDDCTHAGADRCCHRHAVAKCPSMSRWARIGSAFNFWQPFAWKILPGPITQEIMQVSALNLIIAAQQARAPAEGGVKRPQESAVRPANAFTPQAFQPADAAANKAAPPAPGPAPLGSQIDIRV
jgi:hypothetical protein